MTINLPDDLQEQAKDAFWLVRDDYRTFSDWVASAIEAKIAETRAAKDVEAIPSRPKRGLPTGRPLG